MSLLASASLVLAGIVIVFSQTEPCANLVIYNLKNEEISINENDYVHLKFGVNDSACKDYKIAVKTYTRNGTTEEDGRIKISHANCTVTTHENVNCSGTEAELYRRMNRSHEAIQWHLTWFKNGRFRDVFKRLRLRISYRPNITSLTVNGQEVHSVYLLDERQEAVVTCFFDKGDPPATFRLVNEVGQEVTSALADNHITHSVRADGCEQPWPTLLCEGDGSKQNRSVTFLVRCPPVFVNTVPKVADFEMFRRLQFHMKAHTKSVEKCIFAFASFEENSSTAVSCSMSGNPPNFVLTVELHKKENSFLGTWTLSVGNEVGVANTTLFFIVTAKYASLRRMELLKQVKERKIVSPVSPK